MTSIRSNFQAFGALAVLAIGALFANPALAVCVAQGGACGVNPCCAADNQCVGGECVLQTFGTSCANNGQCISGNCSGGGECLPSTTINQSCFVNNDCGITALGQEMACFNGQCEVKTGYSCGVNGDCGSRNCNTGVCQCTTWNNGTCSQNADCCAGEVCSGATGTITGTCKFQTLAACTNTAECASNLCDAGKCVCAPNGGACAQNSDCCPDPVGGAAQECVGAVCVIPRDGQCNAGLYWCVGDVGTGGGKGSTCAAGRCSTTAAPYNGCVSSADCLATQECVPNESFSQFTCLNATGQSCTFNSQCVTNNCVGGVCTCNGQAPDSGFFGPCISNVDCCSPANSTGPYNYTCNVPISGTCAAASSYPGNYCVQSHTGVAAQNGYCTSSAQCAQGQTCTANTCT